MSDHRIVVAFAFSLVAALGCKGKDGPKAQSFREGMEIICAAGQEEELAHVNPAERQAAISQWITERLRNPEAIALFSSIADTRPSERGTMLQDAAKRAGLDRCALIPPDPFSSIALPEVGDAWVEPLDDRGAVLIATPTEIIVEGRAIVPVQDGAIDAERVNKFLHALGASAIGGDVLIVAVDATTPYQLFFQLLTAAKPAYRHFQLAVRQRGAIRAIPIALPDAAPAQPASPSAEPESAVGLVVSVTDRDLLVFSMSGLEGTLQQPVLAVPTADLPAATAAMQQKLIEIASRRGGEPSLLIMADGKLPMATVALVMAMARHAPDGRPLFGDLLLSTGFD